MNRIKKIIEAMRTLGLNPNTFLRNAVAYFDNLEHDEKEVVTIRMTQTSARTIRQVLESVADIADDMTKTTDKPETN